MVFSKLQIGQWLITLAVIGLPSYKIRICNNCHFEHFKQTNQYPFATNLKYCLTLLELFKTLSISLN